MEWAFQKPLSQIIILTAKGERFHPSSALLVERTKESTP
jgi:hypothetical protein